MRPHPPKISVIAPVYNAEKTLRRCIDSILRQTFEDFELILINDGSKDQSGDICDEYAAKDFRVKAIHKPNGGVSSARNAGLDIAIGEYIAFADSDDYVSSEWLFDFIKNIGDTDICIQGLIEHNENPNGHIRITESNNSNDITLLLEELMTKNILGYCFIKLFKNSTIQKHNIRFDHEIKFREDDLFVLKYLEYTKSWVSIPKANYIYFIPSKNKDYGTSATECSAKLCEYIITICNDDPCQKICEMQLWSIKGYSIDKILNKKPLTKREIKIYNLFKNNSNQLTSFKDNIVASLINLSHYCFPVSYLGMSTIHFLTKKNS